MQSSSWRVNRENRENSCSVKPLAVCEENSIAPHCDMTTLVQARTQRGLPQLLDGMKYTGTQSLWVLAGVNHKNFFGFIIKLTWFEKRFVCLCSQYSLDANIWWITVKNTYWTSGNKSERTQTLLGYTSAFRKHSEKLEMKFQSMEGWKTLRICLQSPSIQCHFIILPKLITVFSSCLGFLFIASLISLVNFIAPIMIF